MHANTFLYVLACRCIVTHTNAVYTWQYVSSVFGMYCGMYCGMCSVCIMICTCHNSIYVIPTLYHNTCQYRLVCIEYIPVSIEYILVCIQYLPPIHTTIHTTIHANTLDTFWHVLRCYTCQYLQVAITDGSWCLKFKFTVKVKTGVHRSFSTSYHWATMAAQLLPSLVSAILIC